MRSANGMMTERRIEVIVPKCAEQLLFCPYSIVRETLISNNCKTWHILEAYDRNIISEGDADELIRILRASWLLRTYWSIYDWFAWDVFEEL